MLVAGILNGPLDQAGGHREDYRGLGNVSSGR